MKTNNINIDNELDKLVGNAPIQLDDSFTDDVLNKISNRHKSHKVRNLNISALAIILILNIISIYSVIEKKEFKSESRRENIHTLIKFFSLND